MNLSPQLALIDTVHDALGQLTEQLQPVDGGDLAVVGIAAVIVHHIETAGFQITKPTTTDMENPE